MSFPIRPDRPMRVAGMLIMLRDRGLGGLHQLSALLVLLDTDIAGQHPGAIGPETPLDPVVPAR